MSQANSSRKPVLSLFNFISDQICSQSGDRFDEALERLESLLLEGAQAVQTYTQDIRYAKRHAPHELCELRMWARHQLPDVLADFLTRFLRNQK